MSFSAANTPEQYRTSNDMLFILSIYEISLGFSDQSMLFLSGGAKMFLYQSLIGFDTFCLYNNKNYGLLPSCDVLLIQSPALKMDIISLILSGER
jgi:hypothetical protein